MSDTTGKRIQPVSAPTEGAFNGHPTLTLPDPDNAVKNPGLCFGMKKLRAFLANAAAVEAFVKKNAKPTKASTDDKATRAAIIDGLVKRGATQAEAEAEVAAILGS